MRQTLIDDFWGLHKSMNHAFPLNYLQTYMFQILEENLHDMAHFSGYRLFPGWFQVMSVVSWLVSDSFWMVSGGFKWFQVVPGRSSF